MEEVLKRHRQEQRDLKGRITQKKKTATKKTRKGVNDECAELERQLKERQHKEVAALDANAGLAAEASSENLEDLAASDESEDDVNQLASKLDETKVTGTDEAQEKQSKKPNRQKARLARRAAEQEAAVAQAAEEAANMPDERAQEREVMQREVNARGLTEKEVRSDGHCMYAAVADQLAAAGLSVKAGDEMPEFQAVRRDAAAFIAKHPDDFAPFLEEPLDEYVRKIRETAEWGGQLELSALARAYDIRIQVLQAEGRVETISCTDPGAKSDTEIWLAYYRHSFGLGEHYNSLRKKEDKKKTTPMNIT